MVGIGPGGAEHITPAVRRAIEESTVVVGYRTYLSFIEDILKDKTIYSFGMTEEIARCSLALRLAGEGKVVTLVSSGDPGIYGMAGLVLELNRKFRVEDIEILPGVTAISACAARVGAPLMHDFAVISLSDLLTPWEVIEKRLECAARGDFVIALYNPKSKKRTEQIKRAEAIIKKYRSPSTPVAIVTSACREGETVVLTELDGFTAHPISMLSVVIIGNSQTRREGNLLITPRGYGEKYKDVTG